MSFFTDSELSCPCCNVNGIKPGFLSSLNALRDACDFPFIASSAYRCPAHNADIGGSKNSAHMLGLAVDIRCSGAEAHRILSLAAHYGMTGIGINQKGPHNKRFIHLDCVAPGDPTIPRPTVWSYK